MKKLRRTVAGRLARVRGSGALLVSPASPPLRALQARPRGSRGERPRAAAQLVEGPALCGRAPGVQRRNRGREKAGPGRAFGRKSRPLKPGPRRYFPTPFSCPSPRRPEVPPRKRRAMAGLAGLVRRVGCLGPPGACWARAALHEAAPARDVLLFEHERGRFFAFLGLFCAGQGVFWTSLAAAALAGPGGGVQSPEAEGGVQGPGRRPSPGSALWRYGLAAGCASVGLLVLAAGLLFSQRSVRSVLLRKGGQQVTLTTHAPFGLGAQFTVPLRQVSCLAHRGEVPAVLPLKVKGRRFYFLLDKAGRFPNVRLFDITVGAYRSL